MKPYDFVVTLAKAFRSLAFAGGLAIVALLADWMMGGAATELVRTHLAGAPDWLIGAVLAGLHAAGVALQNWYRNRNGVPVA